MADLGFLKRSFIGNRCSKVSSVVVDATIPGTYVATPSMFGALTIVGVISVTPSVTGATITDVFHDATGISFTNGGADPAVRVMAIVE